jgi:hypothetical protein
MQVNEWRTISYSGRDQLVCSVDLKNIPYANTKKQEAAMCHKYAFQEPVKEPEII